MKGFGIVGLIGRNMVVCLGRMRKDEAGGTERCLDDVKNPSFVAKDVESRFSNIPVVMKQRFTRFRLWYCY